MNPYQPPDEDQEQAKHWARCRRIAGEVAARGATCGMIVKRLRSEGYDEAMIQTVVAETLRQKDTKARLAGMLLLFAGGGVLVLAVLSLLLSIKLAITVAMFGLFLSGVGAVKMFQ